MLTHSSNFISVHVSPVNHFYCGCRNSCVIPFFTDILHSGVTFPVPFCLVQIETRGLFASHNKWNLLTLFIVALALARIWPVQSVSF